MNKRMLFKIFEKLEGGKRAYLRIKLLNKLLIGVWLSGQHICLLLND